MDTFKQIEQLDRESVISARLETKGMYYKRVPDTGRKTRYSIHYCIDRIIVARDLTFNELAHKSLLIEQDKMTQALTW